LLLPGTKVGRYLVKKKLAEGGMAEIYLCAAVGPEGFEKEVVLKVVRSFLARDETFMTMFVAEARLASRLNHANVVQIFDFAKHDDSYFIAMEYVRGVSLWDLRRRCRELGAAMPVIVAAEIALQVARGLQYAHALTDRGRPLGVVHRDVTPHNVLLSFDGAVKLTDFGIAKASGNQISTASGMLKGKFAYMSPEQARGEKLDARSDLFALGIILWELLTGGRLFEGDSDVAVLRAVQTSYISPPQRLNPDVPAVLDWVVMKALERDLAKRFQTAAELERVLASFVLHHTQAVEDANVGLFVSKMFKGELDALKTSEGAQREATESTAKDPLTHGGAPDATAIVDRDHSSPRTAVMPGIRPRGPLEDPDDGSQKRTEQLAELAPQQTQTPRLATPAAPLDRAPEVERPDADTTRSVRVRGAPTVSTPAAPPRPSALPFAAVAFAALGFVASLLYLFSARPLPSSEPPAPGPVIAQPAAPVADAPVADASAAVEPPVAEAAPPEPPAPAPPVEAGTLELDARPFAAVKLNGRPWQDEVLGLKRFSLKPGRYTLELKHPRRTVTKTVTLSPNHVTRLKFDALEKP